MTQNITIGGEVALCLNGYMLAGNGNGAVITVSGGTLNLCDCYKLSGNGNGSVITLSKGANLTLCDCDTQTHEIDGYTYKGGI